MGLYIAIAKKLFYYINRQDNIGRKNSLNSYTSVAEGNKIVYRVLNNRKETHKTVKQINKWKKIP